MNFLEAIDQGTRPWLEAHRVEWLTTFLKFITTVGDTGPLTVAVLVGIGLLLCQRRLRTAVLFGTTAVVAFGVDRGFKYLVNRPRPESAHPLIAPSDLPSFPSGHTLITTAIYVSLTLLLASRLRRQRLRYLIVGASLLLAFLVGVSRLYLDQHYVTDVFAGWAAGLALALTCRWLDDRMTG
jgi:undecaprenyl-diphosphatase